MQVFSPFRFGTMFANYLPGIEKGLTASDPNPEKEVAMLRKTIHRAGNMRWGLIALLLGLPLPVVLIFCLFIGG